LIHYPVPPHLSKAYGEMEFQAGKFPLSERMAQEVLSLPNGPHVSPAQVQAVIDAVRAFST
jgi:dTDP-3-amino-3,4,6-trideoxy-alpha-D-glucose transaminase